MRPRYLLQLLLIAALCGSLCAGCWNRREPELLGVVLAVAFDYNQEKNLYEVIAQLANPIVLEKEPNSSPGGGGGKAFWTASAQGKTPFEAIRNLTEISSRELFWAHCRVTLFSEELARRGLKEVLDLFERERQFRLIAKPVVVEGDLRKIMEDDFPIEKTGARGLDRLIVTTRFEKSIFPENNLNELITILSQPGKEMIIGRLEVLEAPQNSNGSEDEEAIPAPARIGGSALFRGDRMVGWATSKQTQGWAYATGHAYRSTLVIESPVGKGNFVSIETGDHDSQMKLHSDEENWRIELKVNIDGRIQEFSGPGDLDTESELTRSLERRAAATVRNQIEEMLSRSQELKADVCGFGNLVYRKNPQLWQKLGPAWDDEIFPGLKVDLQVKFKILRTGLIKPPL